jgi:triphosphoribosyl-dephospho-CoA synthase
MKLSNVPLYAQLACILEASAPKPGNVNRYHDFSDTKYEHFLASGVSIGKAAGKACERGYKAAIGDIGFNEIGIGGLIKYSVHESQKWHRGRNTNLGISILLIPLSSAFGATLSQGSDGEIRENLDKIIKESTHLDTINLYEAIRRAKPGGLGRVDELDVLDSFDEIKNKKINLFKVMENCNDSIARELVTKMKISFEMGCPCLIKEYSKTGDINKAIVKAFLEILSKVPDSLIERKNGKEIALQVSKKARRVLNGDISLEEFDKFLRSKGNKLNPGTTADLITSSLMIALSKGIKP